MKKMRKLATLHRVKLIRLMSIELTVGATGSALVYHAWTMFATSL